MFDVIIVGGGPAGLSAALVLGRCCRKVLVFDAGNPRNAASTAVHGFLSRDGTPPAELLRIARDQLTDYDVRLHQGTVTKIQRRRDAFTVSTLKGEKFTAKKILLATGVIDLIPEIEGIQQFYGKSIHHCPYCDAWEHKDEPMAALGKGHSAAMLAVALQGWSQDIVIVSHGAAGIRGGDKKLLSTRGIEVREERILRFEGDGGRLQRIVFRDGSSLARRALFFSTGNVQRSKLAASLGCVCDAKGAIRATKRCETGSPGVYIAGDASDDAQFVIVAAAEGAKAAMAINKALISESVKRASH